MTDQPPPAPEIGQCWIVGDAPTGAWDGRGGMLAGWTAGGWRFVTPVEGTAIWVEAEGESWRWIGGAWTAGEISGSRVVIGGVQVVGARQPAIAQPAGGGIIDAEARAGVQATG